MHLRHEAIPLAIPVPFPDIPAYLVAVNADREEAIRLLGEPHLTEETAGLGPTDWWAFEYPCGLQIMFQFLQLTERGLRVLADSPEIDHVLHHLPFPGSSCEVIPAETLARELQLLRKTYPERGRELDQLHAFQIWRQGDDGNKFKIGEPTSRRTAECLVKHYDSLRHKQLYWYESL